MSHPGSAIEMHYTKEGLFETILRNLEEQGIKNAGRKDIAGVDEFHVRGAAVSLELAHEAGFTKNDKVLDIGCGIGGPCRMLAAEFGCRVTGIDITAEFIRTARLLSKLLGEDDLVDYIQADALQLPFPDNSFDHVWTQHVQMNIADKKKFYAEMSRVLKKNGRFIYYDIFKKNEEPLLYPVPWANDKSISFLFPVSAFDQLLSELGFTRLQTKDQTTEGINFFTQLFEKIAKEGPPKVGLHLLIGDSAREKLGNLLQNLKNNKIELQSGIYQKL